LRGAPSFPSTTRRNLPLPFCSADAPIHPGWRASQLVLRAT
jgi:hypothetical protein